MVMYDITNRDSFEACDYWLRQARNYAYNECVMALVGCKCDLEEQRPVSTAEGVTLAAR